MGNTAALGFEQRLRAAPRVVDLTAMGVNVLVVAGVLCAVSHSGGRVSKGRRAPPQCSSHRAKKSDEAALGEAASAGA